MLGDDLMINNKRDYKYYLEQDRLQLGRSLKKPKPLTDPIWHFQLLLRKYEYISNTSNNKLLKKLYKLRFRKMSIKLGFSIPINVFGPGLAIVHYGNIIINPDCHIGKNCRIHVGVNIGGDPHQVPQLGDNCYLGPGAKLYGPISIGDNTKIGAGAVVNKSFPEGNCTLAGVPAVNKTKAN